MTISEYLLPYRLGISMRMLREETCSITEIAHAVGFASSSSYTEKFRKQTGMTPRQYRKGKGQTGTAAARTGNSCPCFLQPDFRRRFQIYNFIRSPHRRKICT